MIGDHSGVNMEEQFYETIKYYQLEDKVTKFECDLL
jgi:hypothetical protein